MISDEVALLWLSGGGRTRLVPPALWCCFRCRSGRVDGSSTMTAGVSCVWDCFRGHLRTSNVSAGLEENTVVLGGTVECTTSLAMALLCRGRDKNLRQITLNCSLCYSKKGPNKVEMCFTEELVGVFSS